jgi:hypothetical protein
VSERGIVGVDIAGPRLGGGRYDYTQCPYPDALELNGPAPRNYSRNLASADALPATQNGDYN